MSYMFADSGTDRVKGLYALDTSKVTNMSYMFAENCFTELDLRYLDTSRVKNMSGMFQWCQVPELDLSGFCDSSLERVTDMFYACDCDQIILAAKGQELLKWSFCGAKILYK